MKGSKTSVVVFFLLSVSFVFTQGTCSPLTGKLRKNPKLIKADLILEDFERGQRMTRIIVNLTKPENFQESGDFKDMEYRKRLQKAVKERQDLVIDRLDSEKVRVTNRFIYIFGFSAEATLEGLKELVEMNEVISINKDKIVEPHLRRRSP